MKRSPIFVLFFLLSSVGLFAQVETAATPPLTHSLSNEALREEQAALLASHKAALKSLTPEEQTEFLKAHQKALQDPSVQSTRKIARETLHKAMLKANPALETILAKMEAYRSEDASGLSSKEKSLGGHFSHWLGNFPPAAVTSLTSRERKELKEAHQKALHDLSVKAARKTAHLLFYQAFIEADPKMQVILTKMGIKNPAKKKSASKNSLKDEELILGGNPQVWDQEVLAPHLHKQEKPQAPLASPTP